MAYRIIASTCNRRVDRAFLSSLKRNTSVNFKVREKYYAKEEKISQ